MEAGTILERVWAGVNATLFEIGGRPVSVATVITIVTIMVVAATLSRLAQRGIRKAYQLRGLKDEGNVGVVTYVVHVGILLVGLGIALESLGLDLSALFTAGAAFAVAVGLAVQNVIQNFVAGIILLGERTIKPGDVLEVNGQIVKVKQISLRATIVSTLDDEALIVPNGNLVQSAVKNYTYGDSLCRLRTVVGVSYSSDMDVVRTTLEAMASALEWRLKEREPVVMLLGFGASSVDFEISVWIDEPWRLRLFKSRLNRAIWDAFREQGIVIAFPQLDVHLDPPVTDSLARLDAALRPPRAA